MNDKTLLETRHNEYIDEARELLNCLAQKLDEEAARTEYDWSDVRSVMELVDELRRLGPDWVGDKAHEDW
jgi:hypothetical protein